MGLNFKIFIYKKIIQQIAQDVNLLIQYYYFKEIIKIQTFRKRKKYNCWIFFQSLQCLNLCQTNRLYQKYLLKNRQKLYINIIKVLQIYKKNYIILFISIIICYLQGSKLHIITNKLEVMMPSFIQQLLNLLPFKHNTENKQQQQSKNKLNQLKKQTSAKFPIKQNASDQSYTVQLNHLYKIKIKSKIGNKIFELLECIEKKNTQNELYKDMIQRFHLKYFSRIQFQLMKADITQQKCAICLDEYEARSVDDQCVCKYYQDDIFVLPCSHKFHISCLSSLIGKKTWAKCPICSTIFGKMTGDQPQGTIKRQDNRTITLQGNNRPGCIIIYYNMMGGVRNGVNFSGTSRKAYLPNTDQGKRVYKLLKEAFDRKLIFTVGRSVTSGLDNQTVWNGIHHKTTTSGGAASFGYPDPTYLQRVTQQLAAKGVTFQSMNKE